MTTMTMMMTMTWWRWWYNENNGNLGNMHLYCCLNIYQIHYKRKTYIWTS